MCLKSRQMGRSLPADCGTLNAIRPRALAPRTRQRTGKNASPRALRASPMTPTLSPPLRLPREVAGVFKNSTIDTFVKI